MTLPPRFKKTDRRALSDVSGAELREEDTRTAERFDGDDLTGRDLSDATFDRCELIGVGLHEADLSGASILDTRLVRVNAPILRASRSVWHDSIVEDSRIGSAELYDSTWRGIRFENCKLGYLNLRGSQLRDVRFANCLIDELDLGDATATRVAFVDTTIRKLDLTHATLSSVDFRQADLRQIASVESLRGATLNGIQLADLAPAFAARFGIVVED